MTNMVAIDSNTASDEPAAPVTQGDVERFLMDAATHGLPDDRVERMDTHGASVFLIGEHAYKMKRAIRLPGMDFSSLSLRLNACRRELEINRATAPELYHGVVAVTQERNGRMALDGSGPPVEWLVHMKRFAQSDLFSALAHDGRLTAELATALAGSIAAQHKIAERIDTGTERQSTADVVGQTLEAFQSDETTFPADQTARFGSAACAAADALEATFAERQEHGHVRRCHGDLHLNNVVLVDGRPRLFDAIEFNETIARVDVFYDLAFLLMDLDHVGLPDRANTVFNAYLCETRHDAMLTALSVLPLYLSCRAAVRAMVAGWRAERAQGNGDGAGSDRAVAEAQCYLGEAIDYLIVPPPRLVAIGGMSGTGKTTVARALAPALGARPGAVHLRTDVERKAMFNVVGTQRLNDEAYGENVSDLVYGRLLKQAEGALRAGHSVILDGVFMKAANRGHAELLAQRVGVPFDGLWLTAEPEAMKRRVTARRGDASDATAQIVDLQIETGSGPVRWPALSTQGSLDETIAGARDSVGLKTA